MSGRVRWVVTVGVYLAVSAGAFVLGSTGWPGKWFVAAADYFVTGAPAAQPLAAAPAEAEPAR